jgi:dihydroorotate dehydrogenase (NAD+) catalytic subunit
MTAAGPYDYGKQFTRLLDLGRLGALVTRGTTLRPQAGQSPPRLAPAPAGVLHHLARPNPGVRAVIRDYAPLWAAWALPVIVSIAGRDAGEYAALGAALDGVPGVAGLEADLSCPAAEANGEPFGYDAALSWQVIHGLRQTCTLPILAKLPLRLPGMVQVAQAVTLAGADAVTLVSPLPALSMDVDRRRVGLRGELSGPALRPVALRCLFDVALALPHVPLVGVGGIATGEDAVAYLLAGASAVQVGAAALADPRAPLVVLKGIEEYMQRQRMEDMRYLVGAALEKTEPAG